MRTWYNTFWIFVLALFPAMAALMPTFTIKNKILGGGPFREWLTNLTIKMISDDQKKNVAISFNEGGFIDELLTAGPALMVITLLAIWLCFLIGEAQISIVNTMTKNSQKSLRKAIKG